MGQHKTNPMAIKKAEGIAPPKPPKQKRLKRKSLECMANEILYRQIMSLGQRRCDSIERINVYEIHKNRELVPKDF